MRVTDPLIELLAIKLYEHDHSLGLWPPKAGYSMDNWARTSEGDRELYRRLARGEEEYGQRDD